MNPAVLKGKKVVGSDGYVLGEMADLNVDLSAWQATSFFVNLTDDASAELNFEKPFMRKIYVCLPIGLIRTIGDIVTLSEPIRNLKTITEKEDCIIHERIEGRKVVSSAGYHVGNLEGLDVDFDNWQVNGLEVGLTDLAARELGFKRPILSKVVVIVPSKVVSEIGNFITLDKSIEDLKSLVECIRSCQPQK
jgi:sporulation protein YlmC with PRC-barrel domain